MNYPQCNVYDSFGGKFSLDKNVSFGLVSFFFGTGNDSNNSG